MRRIRLEIGKSLIYRSLAHVFFLPYFICEMPPLFCIVFHQFLLFSIYLLCSRVSEFGFDLRNEFAHDVRIIDDHTRAKMIFIMGLLCTYGLKELAIESLGQGSIAHVVHGDVGVDTGFNVSVCIDMKITPPSSNASLDIGTIIPEVEDENRSGVSDLNYLLSEKISLLRGHHEREVSLAINREIKKVHLGN